MSYIHFDITKKPRFCISNATYLTSPSEAGSDENALDTNVHTLAMGDLTLHKLVSEHPEMSEVEFQRLKESIEELGQIEPILVYRGKIIDGRHRYWAFESLGLETISAKEIPHNTPLETVREIVLGSEVRRHQTATQKAIKAWWATQRDGITYREAEVKFMTSRTMISACKYISDTRGEDMLKELYKGIPVIIGIRKTTSLRTAKTLIKEEEAVATDARFQEERHISIDKANEEAKPYLDALGREPLPVIERVATGAYRLVRERE